MKQWIYIPIIIVLVIATAIQGYLLSQANGKLHEENFSFTGLEKRVASLQSSLDTANSQIKSLSDENSRLKANITGLQTNLSALTSSNISLEEQLNSTRTELVSLTAQIQTVNAQLTSLQNNQQPMYNQILSLQSQLADAFTQLTLYQNQVSKDNGHISWLENGLSQLQPGINLTYYTPPDYNTVGTVTLTTAPAGANLIIDGSASGQSPLSVTLPRGPHTVSAALTGYTSANQTITISPGNNGTILITWQVAY